MSIVVHFLNDDGDGGVWCLASGEGCLLYLAAMDWESKNISPITETQSPLLKNDQNFLKIQKIIGVRSLWFILLMMMVIVVSGV